ncbi:MAG: hypothetical protein KKD38_07920 [Candidatus Delongbacteria bacterium]|nr:hypothetical protein [Candidatus Delongbacteria bacterium]
MKSIFIAVFFITIGFSAFAQDSVPLSDEDKLCKEVAEDIMAIYDNWDSQRDYDILYPRIKDFVDEFFAEFPNFDFAIIEKEKVGEKLTDFEHREFVAYKAMKVEKIFEEISRFITTKDFYWGYISDEIDGSLSNAADKIKKYTISREEELRSNHEAEVNELLSEMRMLQTKLGTLESITDLQIVDELINDSEYNAEMFLIELELDSAKKDKTAKSTIAKLMEEKDKRILVYIDSKREEIIKNARAEMIYVKEYWLERKRITLFDLREDENYRLSDSVSVYLETMVEERNIGTFDVNDEFISLVHQSSPKIELFIKEQLKFKFYSGLTSTFGSYVIFDKKPVFRTFRLNVLIGTFLFMILFFYIFIKVKNNKEKLFIRRIPGLDAIDDAVGRATEMGKPVVYDSGIGYYTQIDTIASMLILRSVAKKVAEFKAEIYVPTCDPIILQISEEMVASGFLDAGYPEDHKKDNIFFLAYDQFAFAAGVAGILARKKPATAFHFGYYAAESLLISEAGFAAGAIQVAGTTAVAQLPFFITACDYTLIGEELYAAAAYISRDAQIMTNLKLSDFAKVTIGFIFIAGTILLTINSEWTFLQDLIFTR